MVLDNFSIVLDNVESSRMIKGVFLAGQIVTGRVHVSISVEPLKFKGTGKLQLSNVTCPKLLPHLLLLSIFRALLGVQWLCFCQFQSFTNH